MTASPSRIVVRPSECRRRRSPGSVPASRIVVRAPSDPLLDPRTSVRTDDRRFPTMATTSTTPREPDATEDRKMPKPSCCKLKWRTATTPPPRPAEVSQLLADVERIKANIAGAEEDTALLDKLKALGTEGDPGLPTGEPTPWLASIVDRAGATVKAMDTHGHGLKAFLPPRLDRGSRARPDQRPHPRTAAQLPAAARRAPRPPAARSATCVRRCGPTTPRRSPSACSS